MPLFLVINLLLGTTVTKIREGVGEGSETSHGLLISKSMRIPIKKKCHGTPLPPAL